MQRNSKNQKDFDVHQILFSLYVWYSFTKQSQKWQIQFDCGHMQYGKCYTCDLNEWSYQMEWMWNGSCDFTA